MPARAEPVRKPVKNREAAGSLSRVLFLCRAHAVSLWMLI